MQGLLLLFQSTYNLLEAIVKHWVEPSIKNKQDLIDRREKLDEAYELFVERMNQVEIDLKEGKLEKVKADIEAYDGKLEIIFQKVRASIDEITGKFIRSEADDLISYGNTLFLEIRQIVDLWREFKREVHSNNALYAQTIIGHICVRMKKQVDNIRDLVKVVLKE